MPDLKKLLTNSVQLAKAGKRPKATVPTDLPEGTELKKNGEIKLPSTPAACADLLFVTREQRLDLQRRLDKMAELESALKEWFIENLPRSDASGIAGKIARVQIKANPTPVVDDWDKFYAYVKRHNAFELLQRRLNETAVKERWEDKKQVPGVGVFQAKKVSCTKL